MLRSIQHNWLICQSLILVAALTGFGIVLDIRMRHAALQEIDARLLAAAQVLSAQRQAAAPPSAWTLPEAVRRRFGPREDEAPYFVVWDADRTIIAADPPTANVPDPAQDERPPGPRKPPRHPWRGRDRGALHELVLTESDGGTILVGQSLTRLRAERQRWLGWIVTAAVGTLLLGAGSGWLVGLLVFRPVRRLVADAAAIAPDQPGRRLDVAAAPRELVPLAEKLNEAIGRLERHLEQQQRFTADASHELRTPLAVLQMQIEHALMRDRTSDQYQAALQACRQATTRMRTLVERLLWLARADAHHLADAREPIDLAELIQRRSGELAILAQHRGIEIQTQGETAWVEGDRLALEQLVDNLLINAIQHSPPDSVVSVTLARVENMCVLKVRDAGPGIPPAERERIFARFARLDEARSADGGGAGLGLALCREVTHSHGGTIWVQEAVGGGAEFVVQLPGCPATVSLADD
jgi:two-component system OmpR family sensor kinase